MIKVFIACSSEQILLDKTKGLIVSNYNTGSFAYKLCEEMRRKANIVVIPWWENNCFNSGEYVLDDLLKISNEVNMAICLFGKDDEFSNDKFITRDNVLIEFGIFVSKLGRRYVHILKEDSSVKIPYDVLGLNTINYSDNVTEIVQKLFNFKQPYDEKRNSNGCLTYYANESIKSDLINENHPIDTSKIIYIGTKAAKLWQTIEESKDYMINKSTKNATSKFFESLKKNGDLSNFNRKIENVISFGPGAGIIDKNFISEYLREDLLIPNWKYIPVDFNEHLAFLAAMKIKKHFNLNEIPFAIVDDFEKNAMQIGDLIQEKITAKNEISLFMMLGGTFSNLSGDEGSLFNNFKSWLNINDLLIIDVFIKKDDFSSDNDPNREFDKLPDVYKAILFNAIKKVFKKYTKTIKIKRTKMDSYTDETCAVRNTDICKYSFESSGKRTNLLSVKRYDYDEIKKKIEKYFNILKEFSSLSDSNIDKTGRAIFILNKKIEN